MNPEYTKVYNELDAVVGGDWNNQRARVYIVCKMLEYEKAMSEASTELAFEREVHRRVEVALASRLPK